MAELTIGKENSAPVHLYYEDHGSGKPVVLIHSWPVNGASWEKQVMALLASGQRVITYDRRGFGLSSRPTVGYDYDIFAEDLHKLITHLDLHEAALVGCSMGAGEVARYLGKYGKERVRKAAIISGITPFLLKASDNPTGVDGGLFEDIQEGLRADRPAFLQKFLSDYYNLDAMEKTRISEAAVHASWIAAVQASPMATVDCVRSWTTDFRPDVKRIDLPTLILHGDADRIVPLAASAAVLAKTLKGAKLVTIKGGPHGITWTHADQVNEELVAFLR